MLCLLQIRPAFAQEIDPAVRHQLAKHTSNVPFHVAPCLSGIALEVGRAHLCVADRLLVSKFQMLHKAVKMRLCAFIQLTLRGCVEIQEQRRFVSAQNDAVWTGHFLSPCTRGRLEPCAERSHLRNDPLCDLLPDDFTRCAVICFCDGCNDCNICS